jgi:hypothetical protein
VIFADVKEINGKHYGHMFLSFPSELDIEKAITWLDGRKVNYSKEG